MNRWIILLGCFIGMAVATPAALMQPLALFVKPVTGEFGWSRTQFATLISVAALLNALILPLAGGLVDRFGARPIAAIGTVFGGVAYMALSQATSYGTFLAILAAAVLAGNLASYPAYMGLAQRWFDKRLGLALAITSTGLAVGVGGFSALVAKVIERQGWREAFVVAGGVALAIGLVNVAVLIRDNRGAMPEAERRGDAVAVEQSGMPLGAALRTSDFWLYALASMLVILALVGCNFNLPALLSDRGASANTIASIIAVGSLGSLFGRFTTGMMLDRYPPLAIAAVFCLGQAAGFVLLVDGLRWALPANFLLGIVQGAEIDYLGFVIARRFGRRAYSRIFGTCFAVTLVGAVLGPLLMSRIFDATGSYRAGLVLFPLFPLAALALFSRARTS